MMSFSFSIETLNSILWMALLLLLPIIIGLLASKTHHPGMAQMAHLGNLNQRIHRVLDRSRQRGISKGQRFIGSLLIITLTVSAVGVGLRPTQISPPPVLAQDASTLTLAVPEDIFGQLTPAMLRLDEFETAHGVEVVMRMQDTGWLDKPLIDGAEAYLDELGQFADTGDVLFFENANYLTPVSTRAGLFLNLAPLVAAERETAGIDRYFPAAWASYQWDGGVWAFPATLDPVLMIYNHPAFDAAGLTYPDATWTMAQYAAAARALTTTDGDGNTLPGIGGDGTFLIRALLNRPYYHMTDPTDPPNFAGDAELAALAEEWLALIEEGAATWVPNYDALPAMQIGGSYLLNGDYRIPNDDENWSATLLPNNLAGLSNVAGFAVSAGTAYPELAYELAKHLSSAADYLNTLPLAGMSAASNATGDFDLPNITFSPDKNEAQKAADFMAAQAALPISDRTNNPYLSEALGQVGQLDLSAALQAADTKAANALVYADEFRLTLNLVVAPIAPEVEVPPGEVALKFHMMDSRDSLPNLVQWEQAALDFAETDPEIFSIELVTGGDIMIAETTDCYISYGYTLEDSLLPLDPLMAADPNFATSNFAPGALAAMTNDQGVYGYPLALLPEMLWVNTSVLQQAGVTLPDGDWDITTFVEAITAPKDAGLADYGLVAQNESRLPLLMLMAAYGGLMVDYRTAPATIDLTSPENLDAIQRVLDLVKAGYIRNENSSLPMDLSTSVTAESAYGMTYRLQEQVLNIPQPNGGHFRLMNYPAGSDYTPLSFVVRAGHINSTSPNPAACYRWISYLGTRPELLMGLPAQRSQLDNPALVAMFGAETVAAFHDYYARLDALNGLVFPTYWTDDVNLEPTAGIWINEGFDAYINDEATLPDAMQTAQGRIEEFRACMGDFLMPTQSSSMEDIMAYVEQMKSCALAVDPDIATKPPMSYMFQME